MGEICEKFSRLSHLANVEWMKEAVKLEMRELRMKKAFEMIDESDDVQSILI